MRRSAILLPGLAALAAGLVACGGGQPGGRLVGFIPWSLQAVSADGRSITVFHEFPHCDTEQGRTSVRETPETVEIRLPEVTVKSSGDDFCTAEQRLGPSTVRLAAPLGRRTLLEPTRKGDAPKTQGILDARDPDRKECDQLIRLPAGAAALDVPWVAERQRFCAAPLPAAARRLPLLARPRTALDRLPDSRTSLDSQATTYEEDQRLLRTASARRLVPGKRVWLVPGPHSSCFMRIFPARAGQEPAPYYASCRSTPQLGRRGAVVPETCPRRTPSAISLVGLVPAGVTRVRLEPDDGVARTVAVRDGVWSARAPYPLEITYGAVRVRTTYDFRSCVR